MNCLLPAADCLVATPLLLTAYYFRSYAMIHENLKQYGMFHPAINDVSFVNSSVNSLNCIAYLRNHSASQNSLFNELSSPGCIQT